MTTIQTPVFNPNFHVEIVPEEGIFLLSETEHFLLSGSVYASVAALIDGKRSQDEIVDFLMEGSQRIVLAEVYYVLQTMAQKGYIREANQKAPSAISDFWNPFQSEEMPVLPKSEQRISLIDLSNSTHLAKDFKKSLKANGIKIKPQSDLIVVLVESYLDQRLEEINRRAIEKDQRWMIVKPEGRILWLGPVFVPEETGCWECLAKRQRANREVEMYLAKNLGDRTHLPLGKQSLPSTMATGLNLAATEVARWMANGGTHPFLEGAVLTLNIDDLSTHKHILTRRPQCPACGSEEFRGQMPQPPVLESVNKRFTEDGGHRTATPQETLKKYERHISPVTGIVNTLSRVTGGEDMIHSYFAGHNSAVHYSDIFALKKGLRSKAGGKGKSDIQARVSGLCEAGERYSGLFQGDEYRISASQNELGSEALDPATCMIFSENQYEIRETWNKSVGSFHWVPLPFDKDAEIEWSPVWSLTEERFKYLPTAYLYFNYVQDKNQFFTWADSNGNASGNTLEEAILQGFFEVVERDSVAIWWYNRLQMPGVDLHSFEDPWIEKLLARYAEMNREIWVLDISADLGIPAFAGITRRTDKKSEDILIGFGAHFDARIALTRALTEVNQFMPAVMDVPAEGMPEYKFDDPAMLQWWKYATLENQPYLAPSADFPMKKKSDYNYEFNSDLLADVKYCQELVESRGMEMLIHEQTRPDVNMPVVKVIVPGMRHFWARLGPGRLFDVPVKMGRLDAPLSENQLNPIPVFI